MERAARILCERLLQKFCYIYLSCILDGHLRRIRYWSSQYLNKPLLPHGLKVGNFYTDCWHVRNGYLFRILDVLCFKEPSPSMLFATPSCISELNFCFYQDATKRIMHAPMSFFDTTVLLQHWINENSTNLFVAPRSYHEPFLERYAGCSSAFETQLLTYLVDIDTIDNLLGDSMRMLVATFSSISGAIILIAIILPYFLVAVAIIGTVYVYAAIFYRSSARELKVLI